MAESGDNVMTTAPLATISALGALALTRQTLNLFCPRCRGAMMVTGCAPQIRARAIKILVNTPSRGGLGIITSEHESLVVI